ncbi:inositol monophosphatase family protein [Virgibacillus siamensis]|uniref:inositol monophosphatase family protein n=1 Tax=Virgibacillus siamensis TaxID=480071 RepID=UPI000987016D|nr:inositol monophosphatase family protein [Virgibacillus siamensis]
MNLEMRNRIYNQAKDWVLQAGMVIRKKMAEPLEIETKSNRNDLVTTMDKDIEYFFVSRIKQKYPDDKIISEEGYGDTLGSLKGTVWIIDPIDGTMNFVHQKRNFAISVGVYHEGIGEFGFIYDVMADTIYSAKRGEGAYKNDYRLPKLNSEKQITESIIGMNHFWLCENRLVDEKVMQQFIRTIRGTRLYGSAALEFAYVSEGIMDGYISMSLAPWDFAAGVIILKEVGGEIYTATGEEINMLKKNSIVACNPSIKHEIIDKHLKAGRK